MWLDRSSIDASGIDPVPAGKTRRKRARDHDVAGMQLRHEHPLDIGLEGVAVDRAAEHEGCHHAAQGEARGDGGGLPVAVGKAHAQALATRTAPVLTGHVRLGPSTAMLSSIDEHQTLGLKVDLAVEPGLPPLQDVRAVLLARVASLFLRVMR